MIHVYHDVIMAKHFFKYLPLIKFLTQKHISRRCFVSLINSLDDNTIKFICECIQNAISLRFVSRLNKTQKSKLMRKILPNKRIIKHLCKKGNKYSSHKKIIAQKGYGFIIPILSAIVPLITSLLSKR